MIKGIPVFDACIDNIEDGIYRISLVDDPAVESKFMFFSKQKEMKYSIQDEEKRLVSGVLMRADFPIYRYDEDFGEYYIRYTKETIRGMAEKMMVDNTFNNVNIMHEDGTDVEGVNLVELFIKDSSKGISPAGFPEIEEGSLFATYKVNNDEIWGKIKDGTFMGFSIEGVFDLTKVELKKDQTPAEKSVSHFRDRFHDSEISHFRDSCFVRNISRLRDSCCDSNIKTKYILNKAMTRLFNKFMKSFVKFGNIKTDKGELYWVGEADLEIGDELFYDKGDEIIKVEDGEYTIADGTIIVVKEGLVSEIRKADGTQEGELDMEKKRKAGCFEEVVVEEPVEVKPEGESYEDLKRDIGDLRKEHDELKGMYEDLKATVDAILSKPAALPVVEEYKKTAVKQEGCVPTFGSRSRIVRD